jgi:hypothetical protein
MATIDLNHINKKKKQPKGMQNLRVHWFFTKDSTTRNTFSITNEVIMVSKH